MKILRIRGGRPLEGELVISGSKNAALPILAATLLIRAPVELVGLPEISDVREMLGLLALRGVSVERVDVGRYRIDSTHAAPAPEPLDADGRLRGSIYLLGAELSAYGVSRVGLPGGCDFGGRPIDLHLAALTALGASIREVSGGLLANADRLSGCEICLSYPSVGATVNAVLAATAASGRTVIRGAAREPHVLDLIAFLVAAGARIQTPEPGTVIVCGGARLHGTVYRIIPDMIEAGTYLLMAAATRGSLRLRRAPLDQLQSLLELLSASGCEVREIRADEVCLQMKRRPEPIVARTEPYPGFPTDLHPQLAAYLSACNGESRITEGVFRERFRYLEGLRAFGATLVRHSCTVSVFGREVLTGARVTAPDLRAAAAYLTAALAAEGESLLLGAELLYRGYETPLYKLRRLGAIISDGVCAPA